MLNTSTSSSLRRHFPFPWGLVSLTPDGRIWCVVILFLILKYFKDWISFKWVLALERRHSISRGQAWEECPCLSSHRETLRLGPATEGILRAALGLFFLALQGRVVGGVELQKCAYCVCSFPVRPFLGFLIQSSGVSVCPLWCVLVFLFVHCPCALSFFFRLPPFNKLPVKNWSQKPEVATPHGFLSGPRTVKKWTRLSAFSHTVLVSSSLTLAIFDNFTSSVCRLLFPISENRY